MFIPNTTGSLYRKSGMTPFGRPNYAPPVPIKLSVVDLGDQVTPSAVRADQSASRGSADIDTLTATLLLPKSTQVSNGDVILVAGFYVEVIGTAPRINVLGQLDHLEIIGNMKGDMPE